MGGAAVLAVVAVLAGCAGDDPGTSLRLTAKNSAVGTAVFTLECDPPGGTIRAPAAACAALAKRPGLLLHPRPFTCLGGTFSWWDITISGRLGDDAVDVKTSSCWTPQMELIRVLGIARELDRHIDPLSRPAYPGSGIPRSELARTGGIPNVHPAGSPAPRRCRLYWRLIEEPRTRFDRKLAADKDSSRYAGKPCQNTMRVQRPIAIMLFAPLRVCANEKATRAAASLRCRLQGADASRGLV